MGFSLIHSPDGLSNTLLSQGYILKVLSAQEQYIPGQGTGLGVSDQPDPAPGSCPLK